MKKQVGDRKMKVSRTSALFALALVGCASTGPNVALERRLVGIYECVQGSGGAIELRANGSFEEGISITPAIFVDEKGEKIGRGDGWNLGKEGRWQIVERNVLSLASAGSVEYLTIEETVDSVRLLSNREGAPAVFQKGNGGSNQSSDPPGTATPPR